MFNFMGGGAEKWGVGGCHLHTNLGATSASSVVAITAQNAANETNDTTDGRETNTKHEM